LTAIRSGAALPAPLGEWSEQRRHQVLDLARQSGLAVTENERQRMLLETALVSQRAQLERAIWPELIFIPLFVFAAIRESEELALPIAAATVLLGLGVDLFDDVADGDLSTQWSDYPVAEVSLLAATLVSAIPQLMLAGLDAPAERRVDLLRTVAQDLLHMSAGQHDDIHFARSRTPDAREVEASMAAKSGVPLLVDLAVCLAGPESATRESYARMGRALGAAAQLADDCLDMFVDAHSRDLASGTRTLPLTAYVERLPVSDRSEFLDLLESARTDGPARAAVRKRLVEAGMLRRCELWLEVYRQRARRELEAARPCEPARSCLLRIIDRASLGDARA
jgi:geranylgeranyl pyrophosphate synthase